MEEKVEAKGVLQCSPENVGEFNARLRTEAPELYALAKDMINGLRGARLGPGGSLGDEAVPVARSNESEARLKAKQQTKGVRG